MEPHAPSEASTTSAAAANATAYAIATPGFHTNDNTGTECPIFSSSDKRLG